MILAIDATNKSASVALYDQRLLTIMTVNNGYTHSETLLPLIDSAIQSVGRDISDVQQIITSNGPGSFTGIRIALSTVKALAHASGAKVYTLSSLASLAYHGRYFDGLVCPILDARRNSVYTAIFEAEEQLLADSQLALDQLLEQAQQLAQTKKILFVGDAVTKFSEQIKAKLVEQAVLGDLEVLENNALGLIEAQLKGKTTMANYADLVVNYLRLPQAERERLNNAN